MLIVIFILHSCSDHKKQLKENDVKEKIIGLRKLGFFEHFNTLDDKRLFDTLHKVRIAQHIKIFERYYDPGMELENSEIFSLDTTRTIFGDFEDDVCNGNKRYISLLTAFSNASGGRFLPKDIQEVWTSEKGPVRVTFLINKERIDFYPEYHDDWLSEKVIEIVNQQMVKNGNEKFYVFMNNDGLGLGQYFLFVRLRDSQKDSIQSNLGWKFAY
ncbi:MAG: hypothetical protein V4556_07425 [Bacteroidota bacterium]